MNPKNATTTQPTPPWAPDYQESAPATIDTIGLNPADDVDAHDALPFDFDLPGMDCDAEDEFHDCGPWSEDEEGIVMETAPL